jgi:iron-sulfur cluster repair protein YtfE (RIC family)
VDVLEHLIQEHRKAEQLLEQLGASSEGRQREELVAQLRESLSTHMAVEERFVYPIVRDQLGSREEEGAENEHDLTRAGLRTLQELQAEPGFEAAVDMLKAGLAHHVEEEEHEIFPQLRSQAGDRIASLGSPDELEAAVKGSSDGSEPTKEELYRKAKEQHVEGRSKMSKDELREAVKA